MKLLIAGYGDLGRHIASVYQTQIQALDPQQQAATARIIALRRHHSDQAQDSDHFRTIAADLTDRESLKALPTDITHVVYCPTPDAFTRQGYEHTFLTGLQTLCAQLMTQARLPHILMVTSTAVYDRALTGWIDESTPTEPDRFNGQVLLQAETWLQTTYRGQVSILRLSGLYGPGRDRALRSLMAGRILLPEDPDYWVNRIHIRDAARACLHLLQRTQQTAQAPQAQKTPAPKPSIYIGTDDSPLPAHQFYDTLAKQLDVPVPSRTTDPSRYTPGIQQRRLSNALLKSTGFECEWPNALSGYQTMIEAIRKEPN
ncbi:NAD-dependent epimerase/dehydratase family protein [Orrella sp. 11846]|uniref:NAD-dependent epimerase/dehydratase family protein n=1 Tax=Orrella sp. 11846 TaxID=3409913 RepID=UPI003B5BEF22